MNEPDHLCLQPCRTAGELPCNLEAKETVPALTACLQGDAGHTERGDRESSSANQCASDVASGPSRTANVRVFLRMRPTPEPAKLLEVRGESHNVLVVRLPRREDDGVLGLSDHSRQEHIFYFDSIFPMNASQEEVFEKAAVPVLQDFMKGVNGTIFAYGQTGTGKTFTITGGAESYKDRGLIPRALAFVFDNVKEDGFAQYSVAISYLEVYQEKGYDLLTRAYGDARRIEDLQKVVAREDEDGKLILSGLSVNRATTEEEALHLLFLGDTNRIVAETPMNDSSTRSHCIFIIWIEAREAAIVPVPRLIHAGASVVRRSKLHLVDLAGSERVKQTGIIPGETIFKEACSINLALHYLEQVIVALHERTEGRRVHVPYRNSMMTSVLRDSLGGNCHTVMVATITPEKDLIPETVSTCRFAQAVARIENHAIVNEEIDPYLLIRKLTEENAELHDQLRLLQSSFGAGSYSGNELTEEERKKCEAYVDAYVEAFEEDPEMQPILGPDSRKARLIFKILRDRCAEAKRELDEARVTRTQGHAHHLSGPLDSSSHVELASQETQLRATVAKLRLHIQQRDAEICILIDMLNKNGIRASEDATLRQVTQTSLGGGTTMSAGWNLGSSAISDVYGKRDAEGFPSYQGTSRAGDHPSAARVDRTDLLTDEQATALLLDRGRAFEVFRRSVRRSSISGDNKVLLKELYERAKGLGDRANGARSQVVAAAARLEKIRVTQALAAPSVTEQHDSEEEMSIRVTIERNRAEYIRCAEELRKIKADIQRLLHLNELNKKRLQQDFQNWLHSLIETKTIHGFRFSASAGNAPKPHELSVAPPILSHPSASNKIDPDGTPYSDEKRIEIESPQL